MDFTSFTNLVICFFFLVISVLINAVSCIYHHFLDHLSGDSLPDFISHLPFSLGTLLVGGPADFFVAELTEQVCLVLFLLF